MDITYDYCQSIKNSRKFNGFLECEGVVKKFYKNSAPETILIPYEYVCKIYEIDEPDLTVIKGGK